MNQSRTGKSKAISPVSFTNEQYLDFIKTVQLKGLGIEHASFSIQRYLIGEAISQGKQLQGGFVTSFYISANESSRFVVDATTEVKQKTPDGVMDLVSINCTFSALFECQSGSELPLREYFAQNQVKIILWPYIRQFVTESSNHMSISQILLPLTILADQQPEPPDASSGNKSQRKSKRKT